jgi:hypothetical protein
MVLKTPDARVTQRDLFRALSALMHAMQIRAEHRGQAEHEIAAAFNHEERYSTHTTESR